MCIDIKLQITYNYFQEDTLPGDKVVGENLVNNTLIQKMGYIIMSNENPGKGIAEKYSSNSKGWEGVPGKL